MLFLSKQTPRKIRPTKSQGVGVTWWPGLPPSLSSSFLLMSHYGTTGLLNTLLSFWRAVVYKGGCVRYLVSNAGWEGMSLLTVVRKELAGSSETWENLSSQVPDCYMRNATQYCSGSLRGIRRRFRKSHSFLCCSSPRISDTRVPDQLSPGFRLSLWEVRPVNRVLCFETKRNYQWPFSPKETRREVYLTLCPWIKAAKRFSRLDVWPYGATKQGEFTAVPFLFAILYLRERFEQTGHKTHRCMTMFLSGIAAKGFAAEGKGRAESCWKALLLVVKKK